MSLLHRLRLAWTLSKQLMDFGGGPPTGEGLLVGIVNAYKHPPRRGSKELLQAYKQMPWLRAVGSKIAFGVASTTWELYVEQGPQGRAVRNRKIQRADMVTRRQLIKRIKQQGDLREITIHPFLDLLDNANPLMTGRAALQVTQTYLDINGEAFWIFERNGFGMPVEIWPIPRHWVLETPTLSRPTFRVSLPGWQGEIPQTEIIWIKDPDPLNPYGRGTGIAEALDDELATDEMAAKHTRAWFTNKAIPPIMIGVENANAEQLKKAKEKFNEEHQGFWKAFKSHWYSGKLTVHQLTQTFADQQLVPLRQHERDTIQQVFGMPPEILGIIVNSNRATIDAADYIFTRWVLIPRLELLRSELQERVIPEFDERLILDYVSPVPEDREFNLKVAQAAPWSRTRNEWRELQELEPDPNGDVYYVPFNVIPQRVDEDPAGLSEPPSPAGPGAGEGDDGNGPEPEPPDGQQAGKQPAFSARRKALREDEVERLVAAVAPELLIVEMGPVFRAIVEAWGARAFLELDLDPEDFRLTEPRVSEFLETQSATRIQGLVNETTRRALRASLIEGVEAGESIPQLAKRVSAVFSEAKGVRAETIARTETLRAANFATHEGYQQSGVVDEKQWLTTRDGRQRDAHNAMHRQRRKLGTPFTAPTGETAMYPGDFGVAALDINCRCTIVAIVKDDERTEEQMVAIWRQFDRELIPWERKLQSAAKRGFQAQQRAVMDVLNSLREEGA